MSINERKLSTIVVSDGRLARVSEITGHDDPGFTRFMAQVDRAVSVKFGLGVYDFADAPWRDLYDDNGDVATVGDAVELLAEYDDLVSERISFD